MRNALYYYYGINISDIYKNEDFYHFHLDNREYLVFQHNLNREQLKNIYEITSFLYRNQVPVHVVIKTKEDEYGFNYKSTSYILMLINFNKEIKEIKIDDIIDFSNKSIIKNSPMDYKLIWSNKVDYIEYQIGEMGKNYEYIRNSLSYFIGLAETAISFNYYFENLYCCIGHKKMSKDPYIFYNPLNLLIDYRVRDISEYFKLQILEYKFNSSIFVNSIVGLNADELYLLFDRILFPNYYFDLVEKCLLDNKSDEEIKKIIDNVIYYQEQIKYIYKLLPKKQIIEWLEKT